MEPRSEPEEHTELVSFCPLKIERQEALKLIERLANEHGLRIDAIDERPKRLSIEMLVTVTGDHESIVRFKETATGHHARERDPADGLLDVAIGVLRAGAEWAIQDFNW
jgi:hypothetical protein